MLLLLQRWIIIYIKILQENYIDKFRYFMASNKNNKYPEENETLITIKSLFRQLIRTRIYINWNPSLCWNNIFSP